VTRGRMVNNYTRDGPVRTDMVLVIVLATVEIRVNGQLPEGGSQAVVNDQVRVLNCTHLPPLAAWT
jgi:hypothetical protein